MEDFAHEAAFPGDASAQSRPGHHVDHLLERDMSRLLGTIPLCVLLTSLGVSPRAHAQTAPLHVDTAGYVAVGSDSVFFEVAGTGPTVVLIHDGLVHREIWDAQVPNLSRRHRVIRYDRRGFGASSPASGSYSNVDDLAALFAALEVDRACLIGMSAGGRLAIDFTLRYPDRVAALVLVGAVVGGLPYTQHFYTRGGHLPTDLTTMEGRRAWYAASDPYEIAAGNTTARARVRHLVAQHPGSSQGPIRREPPALPRLSEIHQPTLILVGEFDIPDVHAHAGAIAAGIAGSTREIIPGAAHLIPIEQPAAFNDAVLTFLRGAAW